MACWPSFAQYELLLPDAIERHRVLAWLGQKHPCYSIPEYQQVPPSLRQCGSVLCVPRPANAAAQPALQPTAFGARDRAFFEVIWYSAPRRQLKRSTFGIYIEESRNMEPQKLADVQHSYDRVAEEYVQRIFDELQHKPLDRQLLEQFAARVHGLGPVCDLGCGPGHVARYLYQFFVAMWHSEIASSLCSSQ
jgi:hypothetical protein